MGKLEHIQMLWDMTFSNLLNYVVLYERSQEYWENKRDSIPSNTKSPERKARRAEAIKMIEGAREAVREERDRFEAWVKSHPYPTELQKGVPETEKVKPVLDATKEI